MALDLGLGKGMIQGLNWALWDWSFPLSLELWESIPQGLVAPCKDLDFLDEGTNQVLEHWPFCLGCPAFSSFQGVLGPSLQELDFAEIEVHRLEKDF